MSKIQPITSIAAGSMSATKINDAFDKVETAMANTLSLDGSTPNAMLADLDINGNDVLNAGTVYAGTLVLGGITQAPGTLAAGDTEYVFDTVTAMKNNLDLATGNRVRTLGYYTAYDGGAANYIITTLALYGTPDGYGSHTLDNGLVAGLEHSGSVTAESFGCTEGIESSARMQAAWYFLTDWQDLDGEDTPICLSHSSKGTLKDQVKFDHPVNGRVGNANLQFTESHLTATTGGNLSSTTAMFQCRFRNGAQNYGTLDGNKLVACYDFNACSMSRGYNSRAFHYKGKGIRIRGASGGFSLFAPHCSEYVQSDTEFNTQANFTAIGLSVEEGDCSIINANILWNLIGVAIDPTGTTSPLQTHFINAHVVGGNPNHDGDIVPFTDMILVENRSSGTNHFDVCYFDNGIIKDYKQTLNITGGHYIDNGAAILTEPKIKIIASSAAQTIAANVNIRHLAGAATVGFVDDGANTWAGDFTTIATKFTGMASENSIKSLLKKEYFTYPTNDDEVAVYMKGQGTFDSTYVSGTSSFVKSVDPTLNRMELSGGLLIVGDSSIGYGIGSGGVVTQATSRTTAVTLNKATGAITLFTAAGSTTPATFTVNCSAIDNTDTVVVNQRTGTNKYLTSVTAVTNGTFDITFWTTGGTASDAPVFNFAILRGSGS